MNSHHFVLKKFLRHLLPALGLAVLNTSIAATPVLSSAPDTPSAVTAPANFLAMLPPELQGAGKWAAFKTLWQELNAVVPLKNSSPPPDDHWNLQLPALPGYSLRPYYQALGVQDAEHLQTRLRTIFGGTIVSPEAKLLYRLAQLRIQEMHMPERVAYAQEYIQGFSVCRAALPACSGLKLSPVSPTLHMVATIDRIQARAQALVLLRAKGSIGEAAYTTALAALLKDAKLALYLDALNTADNTLYTQVPHKSLEVLEPMDFDAFAATPKIGQAPEIISYDTYLNIVSIQNISAWEQALKAHFARQRNSAASHPDSGFGKRVENHAQSLTQQLSTLRVTLERLDPILTELER